MVSFHKAKVDYVEELLHIMEEQRMNEEVRRVVERKLFIFMCCTIVTYSLAMMMLFVYI